LDFSAGDLDLGHGRAVNPGQAVAMKMLRFSPMAFVLLTVLTSPALTSAMDSAQVKRLFQNPPRDFSTGPLWVWNDMLTEKQIRSTMRDLAAQKVKQVWVHPRPGLMTPYLSDEWFALWKIALNEAERLDMNVWIYDENSYPSGFAGGWVPELMPESRGRGLKLSETKTGPKWEDNIIAVYRVDGSTVENLTARVKAGEATGDGRYVLATLLRAGNSPWNANRCYVDLMYPGVTEKFLEVTLEPYRKQFGHEFGKRIPGSFTDEPELRPAGGLPWTADLAKQFQKRWGYDLMEHLPSLTLDMGDWRKVRHNYFQMQLDLFIERWAKPYFEYCEKNNLEFTGHYWEHEWPRCVGVPDNMAMSAWQQRPGIDTLMNQYAENTHAQFGNVRACREICSLANQLGRRTLCEVYGAGGWDLRFEDMKRIGDWLSVLGVNTLNQHLDYITLRGARKRDHPQSFSYHTPWWEAYHVSAQYLARLSAALTQGEQINRILVLEPTTTAWMYQGNNKKVDEIGDTFFKLLMALEAAQIEYDLGCEDVIARHGSVENGKLRIGRRSYDVVVLPPHMENINSKVADLGEELLLAGGTIVCLGEAPSRMDGAESSRVSTGANEPGWRSAKVEEAVEVLGRWNDHDSFRVTRPAGDCGILFHMRRQLADGELVFLVNTSIESPSKGELFSKQKGVEQWDAYSGKVLPYHFTSSPSGVKASFNLPPSGSLMLFLSNKAIKPAPAPTESITVLQPQAPPIIQRLEPNVLTLDYVDITAGGETKQNVYFYDAQRFAFQKNGLDRNPWDSAVQFKDELISRTFPANSGFTASYKFTIEGAVPKNLAIVIERPDLYTIACNGRPVSAAVTKRIRDSADSSPEFKEWWLDKAFGKIAIASAARAGENTVTLTAKPFTIYHELEPAYVLGDFTLNSSNKGFVIAPDQPLRLTPATTRASLTHSINPDGTMWLSGGIGFGQGADDRSPFVVFDLGRARDLSSIRVWNYCEAHVQNLTTRGAKEVRVSAAADSTTPIFDQPLGTFNLRSGNPRGGTPETLPAQARGVRFVRIDFVSNQNGVSFPAAGEPADNGFVGLAEVQFLTGAGQPIEGVKIHKASSELPSHQRVARFLVDGSGLNTRTTGGWDEQGHPFYAAGVAYRESFKVGKPEGQYRVALPKWLGSVAKVSVNGKLAGYIDAPPWECDVTKQIKRGDNEVEVTVVGTLKNTLGPHHGSPGLGSAWPGMFQRGPNPGPPPGEGYSTVGYGLLEPFVLKQVSFQRPD
jgi:hypothetical protein